MEILLIRHAQASFGEADYDNLSPLGHEQARMLGQSLLQLGEVPDVVFVGGQRRHRQTFDGIAEGFGGIARDAIVHQGLDEFDVTGLILARHGGQMPNEISRDRRAFYRIVRETVLDWQAGRISDPPEEWEAFEARTNAALAALRACGGARVLAISSGGALSQIVRHVLGSPAAAMIALQLQMKNCAVSRLFSGKSSIYLSTFNETPHIQSGALSHLLTYS